MDIIVKLLVAGTVMGVLDYFWLGYIAKRVYTSEIGGILLKEPNMTAAFAFYLIYVVGVVVFVINPALTSGSLLSAIGYGALFGVVAYATYDLTNLATIQGFTLKVALIDMCWGAFITATTSGVAYYVLSKWIS